MNTDYGSLQAIESIGNWQLDRNAGQDIALRILRETSAADRYRLVRHILQEAIEAGRWTGIESGFVSTVSFFVAAREEGEAEDPEELAGATLAGQKVDETRRDGHADCAVDALRDMLPPGSLTRMVDGYVRNAFLAAANL